MPSNPTILRFGLLSRQGFFNTKAMQRTELNVAFSEGCTELASGHCLYACEQGLSWPFENALDMDGFRAYFLSHAAFVVRAVEPSFRPDQPPDKSPPSPGIVSASADERLEEQAEGKPYDGVETENHHPPTVQRLAAAKSRTDACCPMSLPVPSAPPLGEGLPSLERRSEVDVWGAFYIKPNFPGRCSHVCNGGFITDPSRRRRGVATLMGHAFLRFAKDLGYKSSYFNLVSSMNAAPLILCWICENRFPNRT